MTEHDENGAGNRYALRKEPNLTYDQAIEILKYLRHSGTKVDDLASQRRFQFDRGLHRTARDQLR